MATTTKSKLINKSMGLPSAMLASVIFVPVLLGFAGCAAMHREPQALHTFPASRREPFDIRQARKVLIGDSPQLVVRAIGDPDRQAGAGQREWWIYENRFHDSITQRTIPEVTLVFRNGALVDITY